jgi:hypothetical protein
LYSLSWISWKLTFSILQNLNDFSNLVGIQDVEEQENERLRNVMTRRKRDDVCISIPDILFSREQRILTTVILQGSRGEKRSREDQGLFDDVDAGGESNRFQKQRRFAKSKSNKKKGRK